MKDHRKKPDAGKPQVKARGLFAPAATSPPKTVRFPAVSSPASLTQAFRIPTYSIYHD